MARDMTNTNNEQAKGNGWKIVVPFEAEVVGKAVYEKVGDNLRIMKSTKRFKVPGGWIYNTSTEIQTEIDTACAEALVFVPDAQA